MSAYTCRRCGGAITLGRCSCPQGPDQHWDSSDHHHHGAVLNDQGEVDWPHYSPPSAQVHVDELLDQDDGATDGEEGGQQAGGSSMPITGLSTTLPNQEDLPLGPNADLDVHAGPSTHSTAITAVPDPTVPDGGAHPPEGIIQTGGMRGFLRDAVAWTAQLAPVHHAHHLLQQVGMDSINYANKYVHPFVAFFHDYGLALSSPESHIRGKLNLFAKHQSPQAALERFWSYYFKWTFPSDCHGFSGLGLL